MKGDYCNCENTESLKFVPIKILSLIEKTFTGRGYFRGQKNASYRAQVENPQKGTCQKRKPLCDLKD